MTGREERHEELLELRQELLRQQGEKRANLMRISAELSELKAKLNAVDLELRTTARI